MDSLRNTKHLFFDFDDTLWDFQKNSALVLEELFYQFNLNEKLGTDFENFLNTYQRTNLELWSQYYKRLVSKHEMRDNRFNTVFKQFGYDNYEENLIVTQHYLTRGPKGTFLKEGCIETLDYLKEKYTLHVITNGFSESQRIKIEGSGLTSYFDQVIISDEHQLIKPEEKIFRLAETLSGAERQECVMIGDSLESDIAGALNAGWEAIYFHESKRHTYSGLTISNLRELKKLL